MLWKGFEIKSHQRRAHYLNPLRNGGRLAAGGGLPESPPSVIRVKRLLKSFRYNPFKNYDSFKKNYQSNDFSIFDINIKVRYLS